MSLPAGLPNIGNTCWLNSVLQVIIHSSHLRDLILKNKDCGSLHLLLSNLLTAIDAEPKDFNHIVREYRPLHAFIIKSHPDFQVSSLNDSHEVMTFIINLLHKEAGVAVPVDMIDRIAQDPISKVILRDFDNKISEILEACVTVTKRISSDNQDIHETYVTLFTDLKLDEQNQLNLQYTLNSLTFGHLPKSLFINLMCVEPCGIPDKLIVQEAVYHLRSLVFYMPQAVHYITTVRGMLDGQNTWCCLNDSNVSFISMEDMAKTNIGYPSLILYERV